MTRSHLKALTLTGVAVLILAACGGTTASTGATASAAAPTTAASGDASASPSLAVASGSPAVDSSFPIPSFAFPSEDKELEALLPDQMCGGATLKFSMSGDTFEAGADPEFKAILDELGKTPADVSMAIAGGMTQAGCAAGIFRVKGADANRFREVFLAEAAKEGTTYREESVAGRTVLVGSGEDFQYAYFKGDALIFVSAPDTAKAAEVLADLP
ncbi:MAG: hypothetical protein ACXW4L_00275 [Candidatus Limnocylindrales bacterium]